MGCSNLVSADPSRAMAGAAPGPTFGVDARPCKLLAKPAPCLACLGTAALPWRCRLPSFSLALHSSCTSFPVQQALAWLGQSFLFGFRDRRLPGLKRLKRFSET